MSRRFTDPGWAGNPPLRRVMQAYLAAAETAEGLPADADLDWPTGNGPVPSNNPLLNPAALQAAIDCRAMAGAIAAARGTDLVRRAFAGRG